MSDAAAAMPDQGPEPADVRPVVRTAGRSNLGLWIFGAVLLAAGLLIFQALNARRQDMAGEELPAGSPGGMLSAPPPLALPPGYAEVPFEQAPQLTRPGTLPLLTPTVAPQPQIVTRVVERPVPMPPAVTTGPARPFQLQRPPVVIEPAPAARAAAASEIGSNERVTAGRLLNPSLTVPQGVVIAAVLETALDSTRPGGVRAIVSRDVKSFDGSRVLIPRGSRLYGEYAADVSSGQKRALIRWQRLTRPDAVIINLDSPAADPLGRAGVEGKVDSHFFARFGSAILQSVLDIGVGLATRQVTDDAELVALPGSTQQVTGQLQQPAQVQPTLRVRQGTSVSVFVARDLDFSTVDR
jgi:type IV secretion system protein VirB10